MCVKKQRNKENILMMTFTGFHTSTIFFCTAGFYLSNGFKTQVFFLELLSAKPPYRQEAADVSFSGDVSFVLGKVFCQPF